MGRIFFRDRAGRPIRAIAALALMSAAAGGLGATSVSAQQPSGDAATTVDPLVIHGSGVPVPTVGKGAPIFTPEEIHQQGFKARDLRSTFEDGRATIYDCYEALYGTPPNVERMIGYEDGADAARRVSTWSRNAEDTTIAAQNVRIAAASGAASQADVEKAELARQDAVTEMLKAQMDLDEALQKAIDIQELVKEGADITTWNGVIFSNAAERADRKNALVPKEFEDLKLHDVRAVERHDDKGDAYLFVTGSIENTRNKRIAIPPLSFTAVDQFGYPLMAETGEGRGRIDPGKSQAFTYSLKPSPIHTVRVVVTFAGMKRPNHLDPADADPVCTYKPNSPLAMQDVPTNLQPLDPRRSGSGDRATPGARSMQLNSHN